MAYWDREKQELVEGPTKKEQVKRVSAMRRAQVPVPIDWSIGVHDKKYENAKERAKALFLDEMAQTNTITKACEVSQVPYTTYRSWVDSGYITKHDMNDALRRFKDKLRLQIVMVATEGIASTVVQNGKVVVDKKGRELVEHKRDLKILLELARRYLPEFKDESRNDVNVHIDVSGIPSQYLLAIDARELLPDEIDQIRAIGRNIELRKQQQQGAIETTLA